MCCMYTLYMVVCECLHILCGCGYIQCMCVCMPAFVCVCVAAAYLDHLEDE